MTEILLKQYPKELGCKGKLYLASFGFCSTGFNALDCLSSFSARVDLLCVVLAFPKITEKNHNGLH